MLNMNQTNLSFEDQLTQANNYSLAAHLIQIQQASEQKLQAPVSEVETDVSSTNDQNLPSEGSIPGIPQNAMPSNDLQLINTGQIKKIMDLLDVYVDAKDSVNNWCVAKIIDHDIQNYKITIHFDGWSSRYDEIVRIGSSRIAPFRRYTEGYTGQTKTALREFSLNYAYQVTMLNQIKQVRESKFRCFSSAFECTQFLRGELFVYYDSLLTLVTTPSQSDIQKIFEFCIEIFQLVLLWVDIFPSYQESYQKHMQYPNYFLVDLDAAIAASSSELFAMLHKCFFLCERAGKFLKSQAQTIQIPSEIIDQAKMPENGLMLSLVGQFAALGGFEKLLKFAKIGSIDEFKCPIIISWLAMKTFTNLPLIGIKDTVFKDVIQQAAEIMEERLQTVNLLNDELKTVNQEDLRLFINLMASFKSLTTDINKFEITEIYELEIAKRLLICPYFEKRIKGMKEFKNIQEKIFNAINKTHQECRQFGLDFAKFLTTKTFSEWIIKNKVIDYIFKENPHAQLIQRSSCILQILTEEPDLFPAEYIDWIWNCCSSEKHEDIVRATYELIVELARNLPPERHEQLFSLIKKLNIEQIDQKTVQFLKDYSINTINNLRDIKKKQENSKSKGSRASNQTGSGISQMFQRDKKKSVMMASAPVSVDNPMENVNEQIEDQKYFDLQLFWEIAQDQNKEANHRTKELSLTSLIEILKISQNYKREFKEAFVQLAIRNIEKGETVYFSIVFLQNLMSTYPHDDGLMGSRSKNRNQPQELNLETLISNIFDHIDLHALVISQAVRYINSIRDQIESQVNQDVQHGERIKVFINFIEFLVINSRKLNLQFNHIQEMFKIFVTEAVFEIETREFFNFLTRQNQNARSRERMYLLDDKLRFQVFTKIMCNESSMNCINLNLQAYECFSNLFHVVNQQEGSLQLDNEQNVVLVNNYGNLQGLNTLWKIAIHCENEDVKEMCRKCLCDMSLLLVRGKNIKEKLKVQADFIKIIRTELIKAQENTEQNKKVTLNCIRLLRTYIQRYDKDHMIPELKAHLDGLSQQDQRSIRRVMIKLDPDGVRSEVDININCKFWELMRKSAQMLNLKMSDFYILTKQGHLPETVYNDYMKDYDIKEVQFQRKSQDDMEKEFPSYVIGYQKESLQTILDVLKYQDNEIICETIGLIELLQINPQFKNFISDRLNKLSVPVAISTQNSENEDPHQYNYESWVDILKWNSGKDLSETYYMLTCLKELTIGKPGQQGLYGGQAYPDVIQNQAISQAQQKVINQERQQRFEIQKNILAKGGFQFLIHVYISIKKDVDYEKDILTSKTLQLLIYLLNLLHQQKLQPQMQAIEKSFHVKMMIEETLSIAHQFMLNITQKQNELKQELESNHDSSINYKLTNQPQETMILTAALNFLTKLLTVCPKGFMIFSQTNKFYEIIKLALIDQTQKKIQDKICIFCNNLTTKIELHIQKISPEMTLPSFFILEICIKDFIPLSLLEENTSKMKIFYRMVNQIFSETEVYKSLNKIKPPAAIVTDLVKIIQEREIKESSSRDEDVVLGGIFDYLGQILTRFSVIRQNLPDKSKFVEFLTHQGLFKKETKMLTQHSQDDVKNLPPLCKNQSTRNSCLELLRILCLDEVKDKLFITQYLKPNVCNEIFWRTPRKADWAIQLHQQERSVSGFVGLKNLGCICYMNSILQQLFMIPAFRKAIIEVEDRSQDDQPIEENVLHQVKCIFGGLMEVEKQYFNPKKFCKAFKDIDGSPIDPMVQKDVDEFFKMFMDRIEGLIKGTKEEKIMNNLFQGVFANELLCVDCPHYSEREEPFLAVSLQVKNKSNIQESLKFFIEGEMLEGDNAYFCEKCEKKVNTLKRCCIKRMPNILNLVLNRFEFDFDTMQKIKVNDYCEFPLELDMSPYSQQELAKQDLIKQMEEKNLSIDDLNEDQLHVLKKKVPEDYYKYKLKGIVVHYGTAEQGHYYSFIQDRENSKQGWFEFNDTIVKEFDPSEIPEETFGGDDTNLNNNIAQMQAANGGQVDQGIIQAMRQFKTKIKNAYILIYDRVEFYDNAKVNDLIDDTKTINISHKEMMKQYQNHVINQSLQMSQVPQIPHSVHEVILAKNKKFWLSQTIFNPYFIQQMHKIFKDMAITDDQDYEKYASPDFNLQASSNNEQLEAMKFLITFFMTIGIRSKERSVLPDFVTLIRNALKKNIGLCLWLVEIFSNQDFIKEFFVDCPIHDMSRFVQGLLNTAIQQVYVHEVAQIDHIITLMDQPDDAVNKYVKTTQAAYIDEDLFINGRENPQSLEQAIYSGCQQTNVIRLKRNSSKLPKLIILINSFIHMSTSYYLLKNFRMTAQFWRLFSNFSLLGDRARLYLLKTQTLGRFMDYLLNLWNNDQFFQKQSLMEYQSKFRDMSLRVNVPLIVYSKPLYIGMDPERGHIQLSQSEKKHIQNLICNQHTFLIVTISNLARSCTLIKPSSQQSSMFQLDTLFFVPEKEEIELLQSHKNVRWWSSNFGKLARNSIAIMFAHISFENKEFTAEYINNVIRMYSMEMSIYVRNFERPILRIVQINDKLQQDRIKRVITKLFELFRQVTQFFMAMESILELILRLTIRVPLFAQILSKQHNDFLKMIERYYKENPTLPITNNKNRIFKEGMVRWNEIKSSFLNQPKIDWISNYCRNRAAKFFNHLNKTQQEQIRISKVAGLNDVIIFDQGKVLPVVDGVSRLPSPQNPQEIDLDADEDMFSRNLERGSIIDFTHQGIFIKGVVQIVLEEMVFVSALPNQPSNDNHQNPVTLWIELESDKIAPENTVSSNDREHLLKFLRDLSCFMVPNQQK